ncbi:MAG: hypothetical protein WCF22_03280 [Candidatus Sulfotelmatobacter sp.]
MVIHLGGGKFNAADAELFIRDWRWACPVGRQQYRCAAYFADPIVRDDPMMGRVLFDLSYVPAPDDRTPKSGPWDFG